MEREKQLGPGPNDGDVILRNRAGDVAFDLMGNHVCDPRQTEIKRSCCQRCRTEDRVLAALEAVVREHREATEGRLDAAREIIAEAVSEIPDALESTSLLDRARLWLAQNPERDA